MLTLEAPSYIAIFYQLDDVCRYRDPHHQVGKKTFTCVQLQNVCKSIKLNAHLSYKLSSLEEKIKY